MKKLVLLRPEPGLSASMQRARRLGLEAIAFPLFRVEAIAWNAGDPLDFDALLLTSANAIRHGGSQLDKLRRLPVHAIGEATAAAARQAGFQLRSIGKGDLADLLADLPSEARLLHLAGEDHRDTGDGRVQRRIVYRSAAIDVSALPDLTDMVVAVHSARAGKRLAELAAVRDRTAIAAISSAAAEASGVGWACVEAAGEPNDDSLLALAARLCHTS